MVKSEYLMLPGVLPDKVTPNINFAVKAVLHFDVLVVKQNCK